MTWASTTTASSWADRVRPAREELAAAWYPDGKGGYTIQLLDPLPGHIHCIGTAINNRGDIVGMSDPPGYQGGPTVWFNSPDGIMDLPPWAPDPTPPTSTTTASWWAAAA